MKSDQDIFAAFRALDEGKTITTVNLQKQSAYIMRVPAYKAPIACNLALPERMREKMLANGATIQVEAINYIIHKDNSVRAWQITSDDIVREDYIIIDE